MTQSFRNMLYLMGDNSNHITTDLDIEQIRKYSVSQGVWTIVFPELEKHADLNHYLNEFMRTVSMSIQRNLFQLQTISELNNAGYKACLLKGAAVALAYTDPACRISGDTDILIKPEQEQDIIMFLKERGYTVKPRNKNDHHFQAYHPVGGVLEGHVRLYSILAEEILFDRLQLYSEEWVTEEIGGYTIPILGLNDGLMFLTAHYIKHFVNKGGGVRQMMDLLLYIERYKDKLDFERYSSLLKQLKYDKLVDIIKTIGAKYWGLDYPIKYEDLAEEVLDDCEAGGIFGYDTKDRMGFYSLYCEHRTQKVKARYLRAFKEERSLLSRLFPTRKKLIKEGFIRADKAILYPYFLIKHFWRRIHSVDKKKIHARLDLIKRLDMIN